MADVILDTLHDKHIAVVMPGNVHDLVEEVKGELSAKAGVDVGTNKHGLQANGHEREEDASLNMHGQLEQHAAEDVLNSESAKNVDHIHDGEENPSSRARESEHGQSHLQPELADLNVGSAATKEDKSLNVIDNDNVPEEGTEGPADKDIVDDTTVERHPAELEDLKQTGEGPALTTEEDKAHHAEVEAEASDADPYGIDNSAEGVELPKGQSLADHATTQVESNPVVFEDIMAPEETIAEPKHVPASTEVTETLVASEEPVKEDEGLDTVELTETHGSTGTELKKAEDKEGISAAAVSVDGSQRQAVEEQLNVPAEPAPQPESTSTAELVDPNETKESAYLVVESQVDKYAESEGKKDEVGDSHQEATPSTEHEQVHGVQDKEDLAANPGGVQEVKEEGKDTTEKENEVKLSESSKLDEAIHTDESSTATHTGTAVEPAPTEQKTADEVVSQPEVATHVLQEEQGQVEDVDNKEATAPKTEEVPKANEAAQEPVTKEEDEVKPLEPQETVNASESPETTLEPRADVTTRALGSGDPVSQSEESAEPVEQREHEPTTAKPEAHTDAVEESPLAATNEAVPEATPAVNNDENQDTSPDESHDNDEDVADLPTEEEIEAGSKDFEAHHVQGAPEAHEQLKGEDANGVQAAADEGKVDEPQVKEEEPPGESTAVEDVLPSTSANEKETSGQAEDVKIGESQAEEVEPSAEPPAELHVVDDTQTSTNSEGKETSETTEDVKVDVPQAEEAERPVEPPVANNIQASTNSEEKEASEKVEDVKADGPQAKEVEPSAEQPVLDVIQPSQSEEIHISAQEPEPKEVHVLPSESVEAEGEAADAVDVHDQTTGPVAGAKEFQTEEVSHKAQEKTETLVENAPVAGEDVQSATERLEEPKDGAAPDTSVDDSAEAPVEKESAADAKAAQAEPAKVNVTQVTTNEAEGTETATAEETDGDEEERTEFVAEPQQGPEETQSAAPEPAEPISKEELNQDSEQAEPVAEEDNQDDAAVPAPALEAAKAEKDVVSATEPEILEATQGDAAGLAIPPEVTETEKDVIPSDATDTVEPKDEDAAEAAPAPEAIEAKDIPSETANTEETKHEDTVEHVSAPEATAAGKDVPSETPQAEATALAIVIETEPAEAEAEETKVVPPAQTGLEMPNESPEARAEEPSVPTAEEEKPSADAAKFTESPVKATQGDSFVSEHKAFDPVSAQVTVALAATESVTTSDFFEAQDDSREPAPASAVHPMEEKSEVVQPSDDAVISETHGIENEGELEERSVRETQELTQSPKVVQEASIEANQDTVTEPSAVIAEETFEGPEVKVPEEGAVEPIAPVEPADVSIEGARIVDVSPSGVTTEIEPSVTAIVTEDTAAVPLSEESAEPQRVDSQSVTNDEDTAPPAAEFAADDEAVPGSAEASLEKEAAEVMTKDEESAVTTDLEAESTIAEPVQELEKDGALEQVNTSSGEADLSVSGGADLEKADNTSDFTATVPVPAPEVTGKVGSESTTTATGSSIVAHIEDPVEKPTVSLTKEAVEGDDLQEILENIRTSSEGEKNVTTENTDMQSPERVHVSEKAVPNTEEQSDEGETLAAEAVDLDSGKAEKVLGAEEPQTLGSLDEQVAEGETSQTVKGFAEGGQAIEPPTGGVEDTRVGEGDHVHVDLPATKPAFQTPLEESDNERPAEGTPEPAGADVLVIDETTGAVGDAVLATINQADRLIVPEILELVSGHNTQATVETTHAEVEQTSTSAALEELVPHVSREDSSAVTHEQASDFATEAEASAESVPKVYVELPTPSAQTFSKEDKEPLTPGAKESPVVLERDIPSETTGPESVNQTRSTPTVVIPEGSKSIERTEGEALAPKENIAAGNEIPTAIHEIDEAVTTPTELTIEQATITVGEQSGDAVYMPSIGRVAPADVTEVDVNETASHEDSAQSIPSERQSTDFDKHEIEHAESIPDNAHEYERSEPPVIIDAQVPTIEAAPSESFEDDNNDIPEGSSRALAIDTNVQESPERPKSPWTPSYSVTQQGLGITQPAEENDVLENHGEIEISDLQSVQEHESLIKDTAPAETETVVHGFDARAKTPEITERQTESITPKRAKGGEVTEQSVDVERPKSPYPPSYSVTQMGPGPEVTQGDNLARHGSERITADPLAKKLPEKLSDALPRELAEEEAEGMIEGTGSEVASDVPEVPLTPRSELGIFTPNFDSRSEISIASHEPIAPSSPRLDPEESIFPDSAMSTPVGKTPARVNTSDLDVPTDTSESVIPLPAPLVPVQTPSVPAPEVQVAVDITTEEPGNETLHSTIDEHKDIAGGADDKSVASDSMSRLTTHVGSEVDSIDGRLSTISASEAPTDIESEIGSSAFDGDIESVRPASTIDSMETDSWARDTDVERVSQPEVDGEEPVEVEASSESEHSEPEIVDNEEASQSGSKISESEAMSHESPVLVATPKNESALSETESEFEAISNPGFATSLKDHSDGMSELSTIHDDSTHAGPIEDIPIIPSSASQLAIPDPDEGSGAPTPRAESPTVTSMSLDYADSDAQFSSSLVLVDRNTETDLTTADEEDLTLTMPKIDTRQIVESDVGSIEPLDDDTVRQLSDGSSSPAEPTVVVQTVEPRPANISLKPLPELPMLPAIVTPDGVGPSVSPKPFPGGLVSLDEENPVADFMPVSPPLGARRRLESTASSLVFPGAWVTSPTLPERASLEVATGEFSRPPPGKISRNNSGTSPETTPLVTPTTEDEDKKRCIIM